MTNCRRGDVVLVHFPNSSLAATKKRPALVVQADALGTGLPQVVVAMISSNLNRRGHPSRVFIARQSPAGAASGLLTDSVVMADNVATVLEGLLERRIGSLADMTAVDTALRHTLAL